MRRSSIAVAVALGLVGLPVCAQEAQKAEPDAQKVEKRTPAERCVPGPGLRIQLLITRLQGEKKQASLPYTFVVSARPSSICQSAHVRMRMGVDTPVPTSVRDESGKPTAQRTVQYKTVGTNIDCSADDLGDGRYKLSLMVENSSALPGEKTPGIDMSEYPLFRKFEMSLDPILRNGQKAETVSSTDPVTGEVVKIDVSLNVVK
jgi:hypothetical protein